MVEKNPIDKALLPRWGGIREVSLESHLYTLPETNSKFAPENKPGPKRKVLGGSSQLVSS